MWTHQDWARHTSRRRYREWSTNLFTSRSLRRVFPQWAFLIAWSATAVCTSTTTGNFLLLYAVKIDLTPLSLISTFVGFLLTLRSNQALARLGDGRLAFGQVILYTRDMAHVIATDSYPKDPQLGTLVGTTRGHFWMAPQNSIYVVNISMGMIMISLPAYVNNQIPVTRNLFCAAPPKKKKKTVAVAQNGYDQSFSHWQAQLPDAVQTRNGSKDTVIESLHHDV